MMSTMAIWAFLGVLSGYLVYLGTEKIARLELGLDALALDNPQHKFDIGELYRRVGKQEEEALGYLGLALRVHECEQKLQDVSLLLDHLGLEVQEPTTTPRRLVPKGKEGKE